MQIVINRKLGLECLKGKNSNGDKRNGERPRWLETWKYKEFERAREEVEFLIEKKKFKGDFLKKTLLHPLGGCEDRTQDCWAFGIDSQTF